MFVVISVCVFKSVSVHSCSKVQCRVLEIVLIAKLNKALSLLRILIKHQNTACVTPEYEKYSLEQKLCCII